MKNLFKIALALAVSAFPLQAFAQNRLPTIAEKKAYGTAGNWSVITEGNVRCWMVKGDQESLFGFTSDRAGEFGIVFSMNKLFSELPASAIFKDSIFSSKFDTYRLNFTFAGSTNGRDIFYRAPIGRSVMASIASKAMMSIGVFVKADGDVFQFTHGYRITAFSEGKALLDKCSASLR